jgi:sialic acid synthase SpsE
LKSLKFKERIADEEFMWDVYPKSKFFFICENAVNWNTLEDAKEVIEKQAILNKKSPYTILSKFQLFKEENIVNPRHKYYCLDRQLSYEQAKELYEYGQSLDLEVFFTAMFPEAVKWINEIGCSYIKIRCYDENNSTLKQEINWHNKATVIQSVSMETSGFYHSRYKLFCVQEYPAKLIDYLFVNYDVYSGFSDHTLTLQLCKYWIKFYEKYLHSYHRNWFFERHVCLDRLYNDCLEQAWATPMSKLEEVLVND